MNTYFDKKSLETGKNNKNKINIVLYEIAAGLLLLASTSALSTAQRGACCDFKNLNCFKFFVEV